MLIITEMVCEIIVPDNLEYGFLKCHLPADAIDIDLEVRVMKEIHFYGKDYISQVSKCIPCGAEVRPYQELKKKIAYYFKRKKIRSSEARSLYPKALQKKKYLVNLTPVGNN